MSKFVQFKIVKATKEIYKNSHYGEEIYIMKYFTNDELIIHDNFVMHEVHYDLLMTDLGQGEKTFQKIIITYMFKYLI